MLDWTTLLDSIEQGRLLVEPFPGYEHRDRLANGLLRSIAKQPFSSLVPTGNDTVKIFTNDCVFRRLNYCRKQLAGDFGFFTLGDLLKINCYALLRRISICLEPGTRNDLRLQFEMNCYFLVHSPVELIIEGRINSLRKEFPNDPANQFLASFSKAGLRLFIDVGESPFKIQCIKQIGDAS